MRETFVLVVGKRNCPCLSIRYSMWKALRTTACSMRSHSPYILKHVRKPHVVSSFAAGYEAVDISAPVGLTKMASIAVEH